MKYISTRDITAAKKVTSAEAIKTGLAPDGGLYVPEKFPVISDGDFDALTKMNYAERATYILSRYLDDYDIDLLYEDCYAAYSYEKFPASSPAPLHRLNNGLSDGVFSLELWHGPTSAFKDMALQIMPRLLSRAMKMTNEENTVHILVATSGDTGKAALEGYSGVDGVKITVFYPHNGVSRMQQLQMATTKGENVCVVSVRGNFDDTQRGVKEIFSDKQLAQKAAAEGVVFGSANSINWGRLAPQIVYYVSAYCDLLNADEIKYGDKINIAVPTGNFGNIFAAYIAGKMGLPINKLICASNSNNVLTDFINTGIYDRRREFYKTTSPSMDILVSSNLERLIYSIEGAETTADLMKKLSEEGYYSAPQHLMEKIRAKFCGYCADENECAAEIRETYSDEGYLIDPHTAVGLACVKKYRRETGDMTKTVLASTASPYKFAPAVADAVGDLVGVKSCKNDAEADEIFALLDKLAEKTNTTVPAPLKNVKSLPVRFTEVIDKEEMPDAAFRI